MEQQAPVHSIIVTYNSERHIEACLTELCSEPGRLEVSVVDNHSQDSTLEVLKNFPTVNLQSNVENVGFARAVNQALEKVPLDRPVLLLNPDARISGREVQKLAKSALNTDDIGVVAPLVRQSQDRMLVAHGGRMPTTWRMFTHQSGLSRFGFRTKLLEGHYLRLRDFKHGRAVDVDWVSGGCMFLTPKARQSVPNFDETWFMYAEDLEYCLRVKRSGLRVIIVPHVTARHEVGGSRDSTQPVSSAWLLNLYDFYRRDLQRNRGGAVAWKAVVSLGLVARSAAYRARSFRGKSSEQRAYWERAAHEFSTYAVELLRHRWRP